MALTKRRKAVLAAGLSLLAVALVAYGILGMWQRYDVTHGTSPAGTAQTVTYSTDTPDETPPDEACGTYGIRPNEPGKIELPSLGVSGCIQKVGIDQHNAVAVPGNVHVAGWYVKSVVPGEKGVSLIDGHMQGRYSDGVFKKLDRLQAGQRVDIQLGNGQRRQFEVLRIDSYAADAASQEMLKPIEGADRQLTLITCGGKYDKQTKSYDRRVVVRTKLVKEF
jgi:LPXTG-site transpeptidase (sortase) family protein